MSINEVFPNPTAKQVIFQIRFPNLFFIESKIGDLQIAIMNKFPESAMLNRRQVVFADLGPSGKFEELQDKIPQEQGRKVWQFNSPLGYQLNVLTDSLDISSNFHKTYNNVDSDNRFRDIIEYVLNPFFALTKLPMVARIGLRYVDEFPIPAKTNESFLSYFNSCFSTNRFSIEDSIEHQYKVVAKRGEYFIRYIETLLPQTNSTIFNFDFDGFALNVPGEQCLQVTDALHELISNEYELTIKGPVYEYMRDQKND